MSNEYKELYSLLLKYLNLIIEGAQFYGDEAYRSDLSEAIKTSLPLFSWLSKKTESTETEVTNLLEKFKKNYFLDSLELEEKDFDDKEISELKDEINYLKICVKNICDQDLDNLDLEEVIKAEKPRPPLTYKQDIDSVAVYKHFFNTAQEAPESVSKIIDDLVLRSHAWERLNQDISNGNLYIYTTKPKRNVLIKQILCYILGLGILLSLAILVAATVVNGITPPSKWVLILLAITSIFYFSFSLKHLLKTFGNDNYKYSFQKITFYYTFFFALFFSLTLSLGTPNGGESLILSSSMDTASRVLLITLFTVIILNCSIYLVSYLYLQPKKDKKLVESTLEKHISDLAKTFPLNN